MRASRCLPVLTISCLLAACAARNQQRPEPPTTSPETEIPVPISQIQLPAPANEAPPERRVDDAKLPQAASAGRVEQAQLSKDEIVAARKSMERDKLARAPMTLATSNAIASPPQLCCAQPLPQNTERYEHFSDNPVHRAADDPVSTFSIDVDTGSYTNVRRFLSAGQLPPTDAVRVEEMLNYFDYSYPLPQSRDVPFRVTTELGAAPWNANAMLMRVGIKGYAVPASQRPAANLVFLIDVSGSMNSPDKLPLLKNGLRLLTQQLSAHDRVAMVVYAGTSGVVLESTTGDHKERILGALDGLEAGGSTNGGEGITRAYRVARENFIAGGINRVILATDGDFNVGVTNYEALLDIAKRERKSGVALTTLGFGTGNYNEQLMERLADAGDGNYSYVDNIAEARKVLVEELSSTLMTIAKDVKIQVEFNPAQVAEYRLIGYENRALAREDFNNDKVDAGDIGAGHRVTALYEIVPVGKPTQIDPLRYGAARESTRASDKGTAEEIAFVRLRYKRPDQDNSQLLEYPVLRSSLVAAGKESTDFRFAASVAAFGQKLRGGKYLGNFEFEAIRKLATEGLSTDHDGYRREFVSLVQLAESLAPRPEKVGSTDEVPSR